jgi:glycosyltransferase involved in cell wall biosynthesis
VRRDPIKLLFVLPSFTFGGAERTSLNLLGGIDRNKIRICLVTSKNMFHYFQHIGVDKFLSIEDLGIDVWFHTLKRFIHDIRKVAFVLKTEHPDLAFGMMHYPSSLLAFAKKVYNLKVKVIVSPRGPSTEYLKYFEPTIYRRVSLKWIFGFFCRSADRIVVASTGMKEECVRDYHAIPENVEVIPNSIDIHDIKKKADEAIDIDIPPDFSVIATAGRLEREKNMPILFKAFSEIRKREKVKLLVIGSGSEKHPLEKLSDELDIRRDVIFVGYQSNLYKFIKKADIFVHTCLFEGFANVIVEAMACGVPVVAVDCPYGPRDIIEHGVNGLLVPIQSEGSLVEALSTLLKNEQLRKDMSRRGLTRASVFAVDTMAGSYQRLFEDMVR